MSDTEAPPRRKHGEFWRACTFLAPYRGMVIASIFCALGVGVVMTSGLGAMLPILRVLINGQSIQNWVDQQIVESRLDVKLSAEPDELRLIRVNAEGAAYRAGARAGDVLVTSDDTSPLNALADGRTRDVLLQPGQRPLRLESLEPLAWYARLGQNLAGRLPTHPVAAIGAVFLIIAALSVVGNVVRFCQEYLSDKAAINAVNDIRTRLYDHVLHIPLAYFGLKGTSDVTSRLVQDAQGLQEGFKNVVGRAIQEPVKAAMAFGLALLVSWELTLFIVVFAPLMVVVIRKFGKKIRRANRAALQNSASMLGQIEATLGGIRVVKAASAERFERRRYGGIMLGWVREQLKMARYEALSGPVVETMAMLVVGGVLMVASYLVLVRQSLEASSFLLIMACLVSMGESLRRVGKLNNVLQKANAAAARIFETLAVPVERRRDPGPSFNVWSRNGLSRNPEPGAPNPIKLPPLQRDIRFDNVTFSYASGATPALNDVDLTVPKGTCVAVVGRNGSGKTTLLALLPRFYDPQRGAVLIDGLDVRSVTLRSLRAQVNVVTQDSVIFPGTIAENIAYGNPLATREQIVAAAQRAFAHEFISEKSNGYDTPLDGLGGQLSGGQRQRLCIARAILRQAPILILDEATSQVDAESEHLIQKAIESLMHERTTFVIAHRFSTILSADTIVVMDRGRIVGQGSHDELLRNCATYQQLYKRQIVGATPV